MAIGTHNLSGRVEVLDQTVTTLISYSAVVAGGSPVLFTLSDNYLINKIPDNPQTNDPLAWNKVILAYSPAGSNQFKSLTFKRSSGTMQCVESWSAFATKGTWSVDKVYVVNHEGVIVKADGSGFVGDTITVA